MSQHLLHCIVVVLLGVSLRQNLIWLYLSAVLSTGLGRTTYPYLIMGISLNDQIVGLLLQEGGGALIRSGKGQLGIDKVGIKKPA